MIFPCIFQPWPTEEIERLYSRENDTLRILVNEDTYIPSLTYSPIEEGVIDELRGKYSRTRKIHDDVNWVRRKVLEDARKSWLERRVSTMMTREKKAPQLQPMEGTKKWMEVQKQVREFQSKLIS
jgi:large subunit ribosomal protein L24